MSDRAPIKSILITGGTGAFGRAFTERLLRDGLSPRICIYSRDEVKQFNMRKMFKDHPALRFFIGDVRDYQALRRAMEGVEIVVHAAALKRIEVGFYSPGEMKKTNIDGTMNVIEAAHDCRVSKVVGISSDKAFQPVSPYGLSKAYAESLMLSANNHFGAHGPKFAICRYGNVWRSTGSVVPLWEQMLEDGQEYLPVTDPEATRFWMSMSEAVDLVLETIMTMQGGEIKIPELPAYRLGDLAQAMGAKIVVKGLPEYEKRHESMCAGNSSDKARRMTVEELRAAL